MPVFKILFKDNSLHTKYIQDNSIIYQAIEGYIEHKKEKVTGIRRDWEGTLFGGGFLSITALMIGDTELKT